MRLIGVVRCVPKDADSRVTMELESDRRRLDELLAQLEVTTKPKVQHQVAQLKGLAELERRWQDTRQEIQMLNKRQEIFKNAIEGTLAIQSRANERLQDQIVEEIKEMEHKKTQKKLCS